VLFSIVPALSGGLERTLEFAQKYNKPRLHLHPGISDPASKLREFLQENATKVLNVAGPRASNEPEVVQFVMMVLDRTFSEEWGRRVSRR